KYIYSREGWLTDKSFSGAFFKDKKQVIFLSSSQQQEGNHEKRSQLVRYLDSYFRSTSALAR
ncbi:hypothetical protein V6O07_03615, partial [Arthrospira platensis SPKY2]